MGLITGKKETDAEATLRKELVVQNKLGMHARPAAAFVKVANKFRSEILVEKDGEEINGKSIMGLMMLAAGKGSKLVVSAKGSDAKEAMSQIEALIDAKFHEE